MPALTDKQRLERAEQQKAKALRRIAHIRRSISETHRREDAHRKIQLGGIVIAAQADELDAGELCGVLSAWMEQRTKNTQQAEAMKQRGLRIFSTRSVSQHPAI
ncbi:MAG: conjugal transfer protein TraD [Rhodanobacteraceae bacterium]